ncbi:DNA (cytosine-5-)-methyltransferase [Coraliomargarita sp. SDUM461004]|uniref:Cytosine-specific methyltransferase n=2 Tax=Thalassobacterium sedimentorum TaxID=3041258 RepID=A0ABU1ANM0_9BACT|nr:DNA (cytosine-5-)-methyltransferase [Coraliomargarita sp. SDUM461004]MDQ8196279.1 DNA (cytosine-5-)-methyltransferase [Coraliomargarita sp. SDUM461004]
MRTIRRWEKSGVIPKMALVALSELLKGRKEFPDQPSEEQAAYGSRRNFTFIDLFAGIGGTRIGFERAGGECVFTSEWDKFSCQTYRENHRDDHEIAGDITKVDEKEVPNHDILVAGFPCQPFSLAGVSKKNSLGKAHGFLDETQGTLFFDIARIIKAKQPRAFLLENVKNLRSHDKGKTFTVIKNTLKELGYSVHDKIVDAKCLVPQHRERIFLVGFRDGEPFDWDALFFPNLDEGPKLNSILHKPDEKIEEPYTITFRGKTKVAGKYTLSDHLWNYLQAYAEKHRQKGNGFGCSVVGPNDTSRTLSARYHKDGSEILIDQGKRKNPRRLTPRECARIMGFPDTFKIPVSDTQAYRQFGNSVVVPVVERIAKGIAASLAGNPLFLPDTAYQANLPGMVAEKEQEPIAAST